MTEGPKYTEENIRAALTGMISEPAIDTAIERVQQEARNPGSLGLSDEELKGVDDGARLDESELG